MIRKAGFVSLLWNSDTKRILFYKPNVLPREIKGSGGGGGGVFPESMASLIIKGAPPLEQVPPICLDQLYANVTYIKDSIPSTISHANSSSTLFTDTEK